MDKQDIVETHNLDEPAFAAKYHGFVHPRLNIHAQHV